jgi:PIN domain nuclease of toxin-antitoxin system
MPTYVADSHALLWYFFNPGRLGAQAHTALTQVGTGEATLVIPVVVIAEMVMVIEKSRVQATLTDLQRVLQRLQNNPACHLPPLSAEAVLDSATLTVIPDIFDRLIVYEAQRWNAPLITRDTLITQSGLVSVVWQ